MAHCIQYDFDAFSPDKLKCGYEITVRGDDYDSSHKITKCKARHIEANAHVDTFLGQVQFEI